MYGGINYQNNSPLSQSILKLVSTDRLGEFKILLKNEPIAWTSRFGEVFVTYLLEIYDFFVLKKKIRIKDV